MNSESDGHVKQHMMRDYCMVPISERVARVAWRIAQAGYPTSSIHAESPDVWKLRLHTPMHCVDPVPSGSPRTVCVDPGASMASLVAKAAHEANCDPSAVRLLNFDGERLASGDTSIAHAGVWPDGELDVHLECAGGGKGRGKAKASPATSGAARTTEHAAAVEGTNTPTHTDVTMLSNLESRIQEQNDDAGDYEQASCNERSSHALKIARQLMKREIDAHSSPSLRQREQLANQPTHSDLSQLGMAENYIVATYDDDDDSEAMSRALEIATRLMKREIERAPGRIDQRRLRLS